MDKRIVPLAMGGLGIGTTEFAIMGLLPDIAQSLHVSIPEAGHFISAYALGVVIGAPLIIGYTVKFPPKKVLIWLLVVFSIFNVLTAIAPSYTIMLITRLLSGLPHGAFFGVSTVVAKRLAVKGREARYISLVFAGLTIANLAMVTGLCSPAVVVSASLCSSSNSDSVGALCARASSSCCAAFRACGVCVRGLWCGRGGARRGGGGVGEG